MVHLIAYDIFQKGRDISALENEIKSTGTWWHHLSNVWIIETLETPEQVHKRIGQHLQQADRVLVVRITRERQGWLSKEAWDWLRGRQY